MSQILNAEADKVASLQHKCVGEWENQYVRRMFPHERVKLLLQGNLVENNIPNELLKYSTRNAAEKYTGDKSGLSR